MSTTTTTTVENEATILGRVLASESAELSPDLARYILDLKFGERDKARIHELAVRNQNGELTEAEIEEMHAFGRAGDLLAILKSKARRTLGIKLGTPKES